MKRKFTVSGQVGRTATRRRYVIAAAWAGRPTALGYSDNLASARARADRLGAVVIDLLTDTPDRRGSA